jgi:hypothetical protein
MRSSAAATPDWGSPPRVPRPPAARRQPGRECPTTTTTTPPLPPARPRLARRATGPTAREPRRREQSPAGGRTRTELDPTFNATLPTFTSRVNPAEWPLCESHACEFDANPPFVGEGERRIHTCRFDFKLFASGGERKSPRDTSARSKSPGRGTDRAAADPGVVVAQELCRLLGRERHSDAERDARRRVATAFGTLDHPGTVGSPRDLRMVSPLHVIPLDPGLRRQP